MHVCTYVCAQHTSALEVCHSSHGQLCWWGLFAFEEKLFSQAGAPIDHSKLMESKDRGKGLHPGLVQLGLPLHLTGCWAP
jgi:hypothetical protein